MLLVVAVLLVVAAALAIGIVLFGDFGSTEGRILATTALLAAYGLAALPAAILRDRRRAEWLAAVVVVLAVAAAAATIATLWAHGTSDDMGKAVGTLNAWLVVSVQLAALTLRRRERDPRTVGLLFVSSSVVVVVLASMLAALLWAEIDSDGYGRAFGALLVFNVLLVALQPILARARPRGTSHRLRISVEPGEPIELTVEAPDLADAAARAIRTVERAGHRVRRLVVVDGA